MPRFIDTDLAGLLVAERPTAALDIGAGALDQAAQMADQGAAVVAVEPFCPADMTRTPHGVTLYCGSASSFFEWLQNGGKELVPSRYPLVVIRMVLQRMSPDFVSRLFTDLLPGIMTPGGIVYVMVPSTYAFEATAIRGWDAKVIREISVPTSDFKRVKAMTFRQIDQKPICP